jgi:cellulose synthase/poly-beta-1,6-N-acetylglucosamine synthase-like glycosyltransferase
MNANLTSYDPGPAGPAVLCLWTCLGLVFYAYALYPAAIWVASRLFGRPRPTPGAEGADLPFATLVLAAYNEEAVLGERLRNALAMDYPAGRLEVIIGSDGSTDGTAEIARGFADRGVRLLDFAENRGKASVLNAAVAKARGDIIMMSDANTVIDLTAGRKLARWFVDPAVGAVIGRLILVDHATGNNSDGLYWKYETFLKKCEARLGALLGANGAIYAIRKSLYTPIPAGTIVDDFVIPLLAHQKTRCALVYEAEAVAIEETAPDLGAEFRRRARIGAGGFQSIGMLRGLLDPRRGWVAFAYFSHKILRWLCPFFLLGALAANLALLGRPGYRRLLAAQLAFYAASLLMAWVPPGSRLLRPLRLTTMFTSMNAALLVGFFRWASGRQKGTWARTARVGEAGEASR